MRKITQNTKKGMGIIMNKLNYNTLKELGHKEYLLENGTERMLQFGEGNFLRGFVDYFVDEMNEKAGFDCKVVVAQPIAQGLAPMINEQEGLYTLFLRGNVKGEKVNDKRVISCISRCINPYEDYSALLEIAKNPNIRFISSNTTEAGIVFDDSCKVDDAPPASFPAKLTRFMLERFNSFEKAEGFVILSCELIDNNGQELKDCVLKYAKLWQLSEEFIQWIEKENIFCNTLVDRIITGYPRAEAEEICNELGYKDNLINTGETFGFWVIEGPSSLEEELPFKKAGLPVIITDNHKPYKERKVRILNGAHTTMVLGAYLAGENIVRDCMNDKVISGFMNKTIYDEIIPTLSLPQEELEEFALSVKDRFNNPFIDHELISITLNTTAKWKARVLPTLKDYVAKFGKLPSCIIASLAFYIVFYNGNELEGNGLINKREANSYKIIDDMSALEFFYNHRNDTTAELVKAVCSNADFFGEDLTAIDGLEEMVNSMVDIIKTQGAYKLMEQCL